MRLLKTVVCVVLIGFLGVAAGCSAPDPLITGGLKVAQCQMSQLTETEIRAFSAAAVNIINSNGGNAQPLTDAQVAAVVNFLASNNVACVEDLCRLITQAQTDISSIQGMDQLAQAFGFNPSDINPNEVSDIFDQLFGGCPGCS